MPKCQLCKEDFKGQPWMRFCGQCFFANQDRLATASRRRKLEEGLALAAAVDARRSACRKAYNALPDPRSRRQP